MRNIIPLEKARSETKAGYLGRGVGSKALRAPKMCTRNTGF